MGSPRVVASSACRLASPSRRSARFFPGTFRRDAPADRFSDALLVSLAREVVGGQASRDFVVIWIDFVVTAHRGPRESWALDPEAQHRRHAATLAKQFSILNDAHAGSCPLGAGGQFVGQLQLSLVGRDGC